LAAGNGTWEKQTAFPSLPIISRQRCACEVSERGDRAFLEVTRAEIFARISGCRKIVDLSAAI
jgi:hypothetical protein